MAFYDCDWLFADSFIAIGVISGATYKSWEDCSHSLFYDCYSAESEDSSSPEEFISTSEEPLRTWSILDCRPDSNLGSIICLVSFY